MGKEILIKLQGGLGNQLFQYALGLNLQKKFNIPVLFDLEDYDKASNRPGFAQRDIFLNALGLSFEKSENPVFSLYSYPFSIKNIIKYQLKKALGSPAFVWIRENDFHKIPEVVEKYPVYLDGYWQSEEYFIENADVIKNKLKYSGTLDYKNERLRKEIRNKESVSVHIRRGDYVSNPANNQKYGTCSFAYYSKAIDVIKGRMHDPCFYFFSDDPLWVRDRFQNEKNAVYIDWNQDTESWKDLVLMSSCRHHIMANSTFSWWGAWLGEQERTIILAPQQWFADQSFNDRRKNIVPDRWTRM